MKNVTIVFLCCFTRVEILQLIKRKERLNDARQDWKEKSDI